MLAGFVGAWKFFIHFAFIFINSKCNKKYVETWALTKENALNDKEFFFHKTDRSKTKTLIKNSPKIYIIFFMRLR